MAEKSALDKLAEMYDREQGAQLEVPLEGKEKSISPPSASERVRQKLGPKPSALEQLASSAPEEKEESFSPREFISGVQRGVKEEVAPFSFSEQETEMIKNEPASWSKLAGEVGGGIVSGIAASYAAGKTGAIVGSAFGPVGTAIGAATGVLGYALYSGFGQENLQSELAGQDFSAARAVLRSALNINPVARAGGETIEQLSKTAPKVAKALAKTETKAARVGRGVGQVVGEVGVAASTFGEDAAEITAVVSGIITPLVFGRSASAPTARSSKAFVEYIESDVGKNFAKRVAKRTQKIANSDVQFTDVEKYSPEFMDYFLSRPGSGTSKQDLSSMSDTAKRKKLDSLVEGISTGGVKEDKLKNIYKGFLAHKEMIDEASIIRNEMRRDFSKQAFGEAGGEDFDPFPGLIDFMSDGQYVGRATDRMFGTTTTSLLNNASEARGKYEVEATKLYYKARQASKAQRRVKIDGKPITNEQMGRLRSYLSEGRESALTPELRSVIDFDKGIITDDNIRSVVAKWDEAWELARDVIQEQQYKLGNIKHYMPMKSLPKDKLATQIRRAMQTYQGITASLGKESVFSLTPDDFKKVGMNKADISTAMSELNTIADLTSKAVNKNKGEMGTEDVGELVQKLIRENGEQYAFGTELGVAHTRTKGDLADRFREYDIGSAFRRYVDSQVKSAMYSDIHRKMMDNVEVLDALGAKKAAAWFQDNFEDLASGSGEAKFKLASTLRNNAGIAKYRMNRMLENTVFDNETADRVVNIVPDLLGIWQSNLYPAYLSLNVKATLRNLTQPFAMLSPELGGKYGYSTVAKAYMQLLGKMKDPDTGKYHFSRITKELDEAGLGGAGRLAEGIQDPYPLSTIGRGLKAINDAGMAIYSSADILNRAVAYAVGQQLSKDLISGNPAALKALKKMGKATLAQLQEGGVQDAIRKNDAASLGDIIGKMLVAKTQYHYGPEQKARYARYMGPLFSMFSKWPTSIAGNMYDIWKENPGAYRKMKRYSEVYASPLAFLSLVNYAREEAGFNEEGVINYLVGDPTDISPLMSLEFTIFQNPAAEVLGYMGNLGKEVIQDPSGDKVAKAARLGTAKFLETSVPPVSSVVNELKKIEKNLLGKKETTVDEALKDIFGE